MQNAPMICYNMYLFSALYLRDVLFPRDTPVHDRNTICIIIGFKLYGFRKLPALAIWGAVSVKCKYFLFSPTAYKKPAFPCSFLRTNQYPFFILFAPFLLFYLPPMRTLECPDVYPPSAGTRPNFRAVLPWLRLLFAFWRRSWPPKGVLHIGDTT